MARVIPRLLAVLLFAAGLAMLAWGGRAFARIEPLPPLLARGRSDADLPTDIRGDS